MTNKKDTFLPEGYTVPKSGTNNYTKLEKGKTKLRILSQPIMGWIDWIEEDGKKKPARFEEDNKPAPFNPDNSVKHFWAFKVWNYNEKAIQIYEVTQATIKETITSYNNNPDWGSPLNYDLMIDKTGELMETRYTVMPSPAKELDKDIIAEDKAVQVDLTKLFAGLDPFSFEPTSEKDAEITTEEVGF